MEIKIMLKFDEQKQLDSVNGALALRGRIEEIKKILKFQHPLHKSLYSLHIGSLRSPRSQIL